MSTINVSMDASSVVAAANAMTRAIGATTATVQAAALESARYDAAGRLVSGTIRGIDSDGRKFTATVTNIGGVLTVTRTKFDELTKSVNEGRKHLNDMQKAINDVSGMFQRFVGYRALGGLTDGLKEGFEAAKQFQVQISLIRTISQDNQLSFGTWATSLRRVSDETGIGIADVTRAAYDAISNQVAKGQAVIPFLKDAADFARVTGSTIEQAGNLQASALNATNKTVAESRELYALFFATIDEGRVVAGQMSDTLGRVQILAQGLGVTIKDTSASIAFLTQKGVTTDDAFTFLRNVFVQMQKPSEALAAFFKKIGVESGQAAIATYGFMGVLRKIRDEVQSGNAEVAGLFPEIRAQQPIQAALNDFEGYERIAKKFGNTAQLLQNYQNAIDLRAESPADFIDKEFNKIKNTFIVDLGQSLLRLAKDVLVGFKELSRIFTGQDSLSAGLNILIIGVRDVTIAIIAFRTAAAAAVAVNAAWTAATITAGLATAKTAEQVAAANLAMKSTVIGLVAALAALAATKIFFANDIVQTPDLFEHLTDAMKKFREQVIALNATPVQDPFQGLSERANAQFQGTLQGLAQLAIRTDAALDRIRRSNRNQREESNNAFQTYTDSLKNNLKVLEKSITDSENVIERGRRGLESFRDSLNKMVDDSRLQNLVGQQRIEFLRQQETELLRRAEAGYRSNVPERIAEAERQLQEAAAARRERFNAENELFKSQNPHLDAQAYRNFNLNNSITLENDLNDIFARRVALNERVTQQRNAQIASARAEIAEQRLNLRNVEDRFKAFNNFSPFDAGGNVVRDYRQIGSNRVNTEQILRDFDARAEALRRSVSATGSVEARIQVETTIAERRRRMLLEIAALERAEAVRTAQERTRLAQTEFQTETERIRRREQEALAGQRGLLETSGQNLTGLRGVAGSVRSYVIGPNDPAFNTEANRRGKTLYPVVQGRARELEAALSEYDVALRTARTDMERIGDRVVPRQENIVRLVDASRTVRERVLAAYRALGLSDDQINRLVIPGNTQGQTFGDLFGVLREQESQFLSNQSGINQGDTAREALSSRFDRRIAPQLAGLNALAPDLFPSVRPEDYRTPPPVQRQITVMEQLSSAIAELTRTIRTSGVPAPVGGAVPPVGGQIPGNDSIPAPRALGGWMGGGPTGVISPDSMYHVGRGEFMVNAESAAMFPDTLQAINKARRGSVPQILGGNVSHQRIGDIYITVNESKDGQDTSRQVWGRLRREMRRGNIT